MALFDRLGNVVKAEWNARFGEDDDALDADDAPDEAEGTTAPRGRPKGSTAPRRPSPRRAHTVVDTASAYNVLELQPGATLDVVRESYFALARRYHPRTLSKNADQAYTAQTVLDALTDALELLEAHLLPLPDGRKG